MKIQSITNVLLILSTALIFAGVSLLSTVVYAQVSQSETASEPPKFLAIQHAALGSVSEINSTSYSLQLDDVSDKIILFSDRPNRIVQTQSIDDFIGNWTSGQDSFQANPPNAALVVLTDNYEEDVFEIELFNPTYDKNEKSLKYGFSVLDNATVPSDIPEKLGKIALVIDSEWQLAYSGD